MTDCKIREVKRDETRKGVTAEEQESKFCSLLSNWLNFKQLWQEQSNYRARGAKGEEKEDGERIDERERLRSLILKNPAARSGSQSGEAGYAHSQLSVHTGKPVTPPGSYQVLAGCCVNPNVNISRLFMSKQMKKLVWISEHC